ncbi:hypothetical protein [Sphingopyxis lindanitolerans]|uniref:hypothetical protein n=1 Tax=Sphingopyxis lindanitolerans TaxID=2054227 RepID=UPI001304A6F6|nr:hypothetical protein [Sphingopyxis lindanitolerans]
MPLFTPSSMTSCADAALAEARIKARAEIPVPTTMRPDRARSGAKETPLNGMGMDSVFIWISFIWEPFMEISHQPSAAEPRARRLLGFP